ncbi:trypsin-like serine peptidase [Rhizobium ruizarguesonis]|uniref:trypsin-like serine peptidase n=1 Tax=Rhizobium ruizarguesonis TaxID=2081791 RepID=UPI001FEE475E|nr:trypsin-like peptidase domain-containing protein [Rhizobium ruizarguesonis]
MVGQVILEVPDPSGGTTTSNVCSALAISQRYILTARHCFLSPSGGMVAYLNSYVSMGRTENSVKTYKLKHDFADQSDIDDFVVIASEEQITEFAAPLLKSSENPLSDDKDLFVLHYPGPGTLVITRMDCHSSNPAINGNSFFHTCDTDPGSSGAPVFDGSFNLIGLHLEGGRAGDPNSSNRGVTIQELLSKSEILRAAFQEAKVVQGAVSTAPVVEYEYRVSTGGRLIKQGKGWVFKRDDMASALVEQKSPERMWTFWDPNRDVVLRWPIPGGDLQVRSAAGDHEFEIIGTVSQTSGPKK